MPSFPQEAKTRGFVIEEWTDELRWARDGCVFIHIRAEDSSRDWIKAVPGPVGEQSGALGLRSEVRS